MKKCVITKMLKNDFVKDGANKINGIDVKLFFNTTDDAFKYYSKVENNQYLFAKVAEVGGNKGLLIIFDLGSDITISTIQTKSKDYVLYVLKLKRKIKDN